MEATVVANSTDPLVLQPVWDYIRFNYGTYVRSPLFPPFMALSLDYTWVAVFTFIDLVLCDVPFFKNAKIQKDRKVTWALMKESLHLQMFNQLLWIYPMALVQVVWVPDADLPDLAPPLWELIWQNTVFFICFDFYYFVAHVVMHKIKFLYRWCHSVHHMYSSPFCAAAQHLHPFELFVVATFITTFPWLFTTHPLTYWTWFVIAQSVSYEVHTGYDFPFFLHRFLPFYSGAPAHDMHHLRPLTCFEPWFNYLDRIFGHHISYDDLKQMTKDKATRYGLYEAKDVKGLKKIN